MKRNKSKRQKTISRKQRRLPKAIQRAPENVVRLVQPEQPPRRKGKLHISDTILARARALQPKPEQWPRPHGHPGHAFFVKGYSPFPPNAAPPDAGMAMDADSNQQIIASASWAAGALAGGYSEGLWFLGYPLLSEMMQRPEYRRMVERIAMEMTRKWIKLQSSAAEDDGKKNERVERIAKMEDEMKRLHVRDCFREIAEQDGAFGRSHLYLDTGDTDDREELMTPLGDGSNKISQSKVSRDRPLLRIKTIEPVWVYPTNYNSNDPMRTDWYNPTMWFVQGKQVHASRLLRFVGREVPDLLKPAYSFGGLPLIQMAKPYVDNWIRTRQAVADLVWSFSVSGLKTDLGSDLQEQGDDLFKRVDFFNSIRNNRGTMVLDKEAEDFFNITTPLSSLDVLQAQAQEHMAAVCGIPLVILLGISPHGLNASSEGEIRAFYDWVHAYQEAFFSDNLKRVLDFIQLSLFGNIDPSITFRYEPLWSLDDKAEAEKRKIEADTDVALIGGGVLDPLESRQRLASDPDSPFASIDVQDVPEPPQQDPEGGGGELGDEDGAPAPDDDGDQAPDAEGL